MERKFSAFKMDLVDQLDPSPNNRKGGSLSAKLRASLEEEPADAQKKREDMQKCPAWVLKKLRVEMKLRRQLEEEWAEQRMV